jgi:hypothetical protein
VVDESYALQAAWAKSATATAAGLLSSVITIVLLHGRGATRVLADLALDAGRVGGLAAVAFVPLGLTLDGLDAVGHVAAFAAGLALFALGTRAALPSHWELMRRLARAATPAAR